MKKEYLIKYKDKKIKGKITKEWIEWYKNWHDYSHTFHTLPNLRKELKYLKSVGYKAKIIERTTKVTEKEVK